MPAVTREVRRAVGDVAPLIAFRLAGLRGRSRRMALIGLAVMVLVTIGAATVPAFVEGAGTSDRAFQILLLLPTAYGAFLLTTIFAIVGSGGGRELLPRDQAVAFPVSPTTDHLGALLLAPLNIAWLLQSWSLLGVTAYGFGRNGLWTAQVTLMLWLLTATAIGQALSWVVEWVRRGPAGTPIVRGLGLLVGLLAATLMLKGTFAAFLDQTPAVRIVLLALAGRQGRWLDWSTGLAAIAGFCVAAVAAGAWVAHYVARRQPREEAKAEGRTFAARTMARSEFDMLVRTDRASVWRSVPLRRGFFILALMPGIVAAAGRLSWDALPVLPGLVAAGGALLFGVNAWCLDGIGALWRDSLPVRPGLVFASRVRVLFEVLLVATATMMVVAGVRAEGLPNSAELASLVAAGIVISLQVVARSMHWSVRRPFAMDLRNARGTPAPPLVMVGYSAYLALSSTVTGLVFAATAHAPDWRWPVFFSIPFVLAAVRRLVITAGEWSTPEVRARVVATVAVRG